MSRFLCTSSPALALVVMTIGASDVIAGRMVPGRQEQPGQPQITSITAAGRANESSPQTLTVAGRNFADGLSLEVTSPEGQSQVLSGQDIKNLRESSFQVTMTLSRGGTYTFVVRNRDGGVSNAFPLKVPPTATAPAIERIEPDSVPRSTSPQRLAVLGRNFVVGLSVTMTDPTGEVTVVREGLSTVSPTAFTLDVTLTVSGEYSLLVTNPSTEQSNSLTFTVTAGGRPSGR